MALTKVTPDMGGGTWELLQTTEVSTTASVGYTSIGTTYDCYAIVVADLVPTTDDANLELTFGDSGGLDTGSTDYSWHMQRNHEGGTAYLATAANANSDHIQIAQSAGNAAGEGVNGVWYINAPSDGTMRPTVFGQHFAIHGSSATPYQGGIVHGARLAVLTLTQFSLAFSAGNMSTGRVTIYGVAHA